MRRSSVAVLLLGLAVALLGLSPAGGGTLAAGAGTAQHRAVNNLVLNYDMDSAAGTLVRDRSANMLHGTLVNADIAEALVPSRPGRGSALSLTGQQHQYVAVPEKNALDVNRYTLSAWVRSTGIQNDATNGRWEVLEKAGAYWLNVRTDGKVRVGGFFGGCGNSRFWKYLDSTRVVPVGVWTHVASTYNGSRLTVWINGTAAGNMSVSGATCTNNEPLAVGAKNAPSKGLLEAFWDGLLDDVKIWNRALTATEVRQLACGC